MRIQPVRGLRNRLAGLGAVLLTVAGCESDSVARSGPERIAPRAVGVSPAPPPATPVDEAIVARIGGVTISREQLYRPLLEARGLGLLLNLVQLEMAREEARLAGITVSEDDVRAEATRTLRKMFAEQSEDEGEYALLLDQFLQRRNMSRVEWDLLMQTNATLRKLAEPKARGAIRDEQLNVAFGQLYGEKVHVRHIECANLQEIAQARQRLAAGEAFEDVARAMSRNARTAPLGGEIRPFTRNAAFSEAFKETAFALKNKGDISEPVQAEGGYHLLQLLDRIPPKVIRFEDVKESIREDLQESLTQQLMQEIRLQLSERATRSLQILDPLLKAQYQDERSRRLRQLKDAAEIREELDRQRARAATQPAIPDLPGPPNSP
ncbi:MAG: peptidyl-prolyl cis-trans isomerase [Phycisphaerae bacterium]|nr:peptidyl-prolyl cis-trans isomerase [Phycisphaerae bacterium]MDW8261091.1 peptidyl-prolyl cis-trans isomerase [Phycisphaerales bacterium]